MPELALAIGVASFFLLCCLGVMLWAGSILFSFKAPYVPLPHVVLPGIVQSLALMPTSVVYDIGCGDGRILRAAYACEPQATYIGIERALFPYMLSRMRSMGTRITFKKKNAFRETYADATHIVVYLLPGLVEDVWKKIAQECKPGTQYVSLDFPLNSQKPLRVVQQDVPQHLRGRTIYVYEVS